MEIDLCWHSFITFFWDIPQRQEKVLDPMEIIFDEKQMSGKEINPPNTNIPLI